MTLPHHLTIQLEHDGTLWWAMTDVAHESGVRVGSMHSAATPIEAVQKVLDGLSAWQPSPLTEVTTQDTGET
jgi:hypothetical protein